MPRPISTTRTTVAIACSLNISSRLCVFTHTVLNHIRCRPGTLSAAPSSPRRPRSSSSSRASITSAPSSGARCRRPSAFFGTWSCAGCGRRRPSTGRTAVRGWLFVVCVFVFDVGVDPIARAANGWMDGWMDVSWFTSQPGMYVLTERPHATPPRHSVPPSGAVQVDPQAAPRVEEVHGYQHGVRAPHRAFGQSGSSTPPHWLHLFDLARPPPQTPTLLINDPNAGSTGPVLAPGTHTHTHTHTHLTSHIQSNRIESTTVRSATSSPPSAGRSSSGRTSSSSGPTWFSASGKPLTRIAATPSPSSARSAPSPGGRGRRCKCVHPWPWPAICVGRGGSLPSLC